MRVGVIGIGSAHGDDQIGWLLADKLKDIVELQDIYIEKLSLPVAPLINLLPQFDSLLVLDAGELGLSAGEFQLIEDAEQHLNTKTAISSHALGIAESWQIAKALKFPLPQINLFLVQLQQTDAMAPISKTLVKNTPAMLKMISSHIQSQ